MGVDQAYEATRLAGAYTLLREKMLFVMPEEGDYGSTLLHGFTASRWDRAVYGEMAGPSMGMVIQGNTCMEVTSAIPICNACCCFFNGSSVKVSNLMLPHSITEPYLALTIEIDGFLLDGLRQAGVPLVPVEESPNCTMTAGADLGTVDAYLRLMRLMDKPELFMYLAPPVVREIHFRMLMEPFELQKKHWSWTHGYRSSHTERKPAPICFKPFPENYFD